MKKLLIDLVKLRELDDRKVEAIDRPMLDGRGFKTVREIATFQFTCRKCTDPPCMAACPVDALEKDDNGMVHRSVNLCIRCKSCIAMCPFGTLMLDLFQPKPSGCRYYDVSQEDEMQQFADLFPEEAVTITDESVADAYALGDHILIRDVTWSET